MNILGVLEYIQSAITAGSNKVSDIELSPPEFNDKMYARRNFPCINLWDNGYRPISGINNTSLMSRMRQYNVDVMYLIKNPMDVYLSNAYRELVYFEDQIDGIINDLSGLGIVGTPQKIILRGQNATGQRVLRQQQNYYIIGRLTEYIVDVVEA